MVIRMIGYITEFSLHVPLLPANFIKLLKVYDACCQFATEVFGRDSQEAESVFKLSTTG